MRKRSGQPPNEFDIGYRRPPKASQFQPGHSGNPRGRPKGGRKVGAVLQELMNAKVTVTEHGRTLAYRSSGARRDNKPLEPPLARWEAPWSVDR